MVPCSDHYYHSAWSLLFPKRLHPPFRSYICVEDSIHPVVVALHISSRSAPRLLGLNTTLPTSPMTLSRKTSSWQTRMTRVTCRAREASYAPAASWTFSPRWVGAACLCVDSYHPSVFFYRFRTPFALRMFRCCSFLCSSPVNLTSPHTHSNQPIPLVTVQRRTMAMTRWPWLTHPARDVTAPRCRRRRKTAATTEWLSSSARVMWTVSTETAS